MAMGRLKESSLSTRIKTTSPEVKPNVMEDKETPAEEAVETPELEVAEFIDCILVGAVIVHKMHLRVTGPGSYATHKALNELYDTLPNHGDALAEGYQGKMGIILPNVAEVDQMEYLKMSPLEYVEYLIKDVEEDRVVFGDCPTMQTLVDNLMIDLYSARYKLKFLS